MGAGRGEHPTPVPWGAIASPFPCASTRTCTHTDVPDAARAHTPLSVQVSGSQVAPRPQVRVQGWAGVRGCWGQPWGLAGPRTGLSSRDRAGDTGKRRTPLLPSASTTAPPGGRRCRAPTPPGPAHWPDLVPWPGLAGPLSYCTPPCQAPQLRALLWGGSPLPRWLPSLHHPGQ